MSRGYDVIDCRAAFSVNRECAIVVAAIGPLGFEYPDPAGASDIATLTSSRRLRRYDAMRCFTYSRFYPNRPFV